MVLDDKKMKKEYVGYTEEKRKHGNMYGRHVEKERKRKRENRR
jgi:hypothetical protein